MFRQTGSSSVPANNTVYDSTASSLTSTAQPAQDLADVPRPPPPKKFRHLMSDFQSRTQAAASGDTAAILSVLDIELERYTEITNCEEFSDTSLGYWQNRYRQKSFPIVALWPLRP